MCRLVDAELVKLMLSELLEVAQKEKFTAEDVIDHACEWIDNIPTAYDVDEVVAELEERLPFCPTNQMTCEIEYELLEAIDIVKRGGAK